jgi:hypothetical protein
MVRAY